MAEAGWLLQVRGTLGYIATSRLAWDTEEDPVLEKGRLLGVTELLLISEAEAGESEVSRSTYRVPGQSCLHSWTLSQHMTATFIVCFIQNKRYKRAQYSLGLDTDLGDMHRGQPWRMLKLGFGKPLLLDTVSRQATYWVSCRKDDR